MKANHRELLGLSFNGRLKNYFNDDFEYHDYNVGDLIICKTIFNEGRPYFEYTLR